MDNSNPSEVLAAYGKELAELRAFKKTVLNDFDSIINHMMQIKNKYKDSNRISSQDQTIKTIAGSIINMFPEMATKNVSIVNLIKKEGPMTSEDIVKKVIADGLFEDNEGAYANIRSRLSRLASDGYIESKGRGEPYKFVRDIV
jgi:hypothetical protein